MVLILVIAAAILAAAVALTTRRKTRGLGLSLLGLLIVAPAALYYSALRRPAPNVAAPAPAPGAESNSASAANTVETGSTAPKSPASAGSAPPARPTFSNVNGASPAPQGSIDLDKLIKNLGGSDNSKGLPSDRPALTTVIPRWRSSRSARSRR
jgi:hypothetical protein